MEYKKLPIDSVELDFENPRIKQYIEMYADNISSEGISLALSGGDSNSYSALKESIKVNKGLVNPIIVNRTDSGKLVVIEGNTRLQIYKEFAVADPNDPWKEIIAIVHENLSDIEIHSIRLQTHLVGPRDWDPYSKAKYLHYLSDELKLPMELIISYCGGKGSEIRKLVDAYVDMEQFYKSLMIKNEQDPDPRDFSKFSELQNRSILESLVVHGYTKNDFAKWVVDGKVDKAQNVRRLPAILANPLAREEFFKSNITEAEKYLNANEKSSKVLESLSMDDLVLELTKRFRNIEFKEIKNLRISEFYREKKDNILNLKDEIDGIVEEIGVEK
ncbi:MAG: ParB N-terminal domain-containing protein [Fibrobacteraceae bacterium]|nr:ParB N-terminal domain-containing protein [Fibrobacteraceae bacterium]